MSDPERIQADEALEDEENKTWLLWLALLKLQEAFDRWRKGS